MCHLEQAIRHPVLAISHIFEGSHLAHAPLAVPPFIPPTSPRQVRQSTNEQNVYNHDLVSSIGAGEEGRRRS